MAEVILLPTLKDNYTYIIRGNVQSQVAIVDPGESAPVFNWCKENGTTVSAIICTHHHEDHIGGVPELKAFYKATVWTSAYDQNRIPSSDRAMKDGDLFPWCGLTGEAIDIPGHTLGHMALIFREQKWLFCGDTLFTLGCGRLFEGTPRQMHKSLQRLAALPSDTKVYCGHEYTLTNAKFALEVEPGNERLLARVAAAKITREAGKPTVPSTIGEEKATNPFLRANVGAISRHFGFTPDVSSEEVFQKLRAEKDIFS